MKPLTTFSLAALAAAALAGCATDETQTARAEPGAMICREVQMPASNAVQTVCLTEQQWDDSEREQRRATQDALRRLQSSSSVVTN